MTDFCVDCGHEFPVSELDVDGRCEWCEWLCNLIGQKDDEIDDVWPEPINEKEDYYK